MTVQLTHVPRGTATITLDAAAKKLTVTMAVTGLAPNSTHVDGIGKGSCKADAGRLYPLMPLVADATGAAHATTVIAGVSAVPPHAFVHLHIGATREMHGREIACADLTGAPGTLQLGPAPGEQNGNVTGTAVLTLDPTAKTLKVHLTLAGLVPGSSHPNHIHLGSCEAEGPVVYGLDLATADASGHADVTSVLQGVSTIDAGRWYVNVHQGPGLSTSEQFTPIACGNVA